MRKIIFHHEKFVRSFLMILKSSDGIFTKKKMEPRDANPSDVKADMEEYNRFLKEKSEAANNLVEALKRDYKYRQSDQLNEGNADVGTTVKNQNNTTRV